LPLARAGHTKLTAKAAATEAIEAGCDQVAAVHLAEGENLPAGEGC
jgi:hypothetical protein